MTMLMLQAALWVLAAFLLGYIIGRFLKALFCREEADRDVRGINKLATHHDDEDFSHAVTVPVIAAGAASAVAVFDDIDPHKPILIDPYKEIVTNPYQPIVVDPYQPIIDPPDRDVLEKSETNWLLLLVQRVKDTYQGLNPHAVSRLWQGDKGYDCSALQKYESITLQPGQEGQLGLIRCAVPQAGSVTVGEDASSIGEKTAILFSYGDIVVCHDTGNRYHFIQVSA